MKNSTNKLGDFVSQINFGAKRRLRFIKVEVNDQTLEILNILYLNGAIRTFLIKDNQILIYYKYYLSRVAIKITLISTPGNRKYMRLNKLSKHYDNHNFSGFYIISTQKGLFTSTYCLLDGHLSGEVLLKIEV